MIDNLKTRLSSAGLGHADPSFERVCLVDDFTASGSTLIRKGKDGWEGKVPKFIRHIQEKELFGKCIAPSCVFQIHHFIGSNTAKDTINEFLNTFEQSLEPNSCKLRATFSTVLTQAVVIGESSDAHLVAFLKKYYGSTCETKIHTGEGIWFGYKDGGLPLVLEHNTPNNSVALLWAACKQSDARHVMKPLFPRKQRHVDHGQSV